MISAECERPTPRPPRREEEEEGEEEEKQGNGQEAPEEVHETVSVGESNHNIDDKEREQERREGDGAPRRPVRDLRGARNHARSIGLRVR